MKALIRAQTIGTRLAPLTNHVPKPIIPVINRPSIEHVMRLLAKYGIYDIVVSLHDRVDQIENILNKSAQLINCNVECVRLPIKFKGMPWLEEYFTETFFALDCDIITDVDLNAMYQFHKSRQAIITYALINPQAPKLSCTTTTSNGRFLRWERNRENKPYPHIIGIAVYEKEFFNYYKQALKTPSPFIFDEYPPWLNNEPFSNEFFDTVPFVKFTQNSRWFGYKSEAYGIDIGTPDRYMKAHRDFLTKHTDLSLLSSYSEISEGVWVGKGVQITPDVTLVGPLLIGSHCTIASQAQILPYSCIGEDVKIGRGAIVSGCVIWSKSEIGAHAFISNSIIPDRCTIGANAKIENTASIGYSQIILAQSHITGNLTVLI